MTAKILASALEKMAAHTFIDFVYLFCFNRYLIFLLTEVKMSLTGAAFCEKVTYLIHVMFKAH